MTTTTTATAQAAASSVGETEQMNYLQACRSAFDFALESDPSVFLLGEDIADPVGGVTKVTKGLSTKFGIDRVRPTPISESAMIGASIGAGLAGMRPVVEIMLMDFLGVCFDQVANHAAKLRYMTGGRTHVPMTIRTMVGSGGGSGAQHSQSAESWLTNVPGINIVCASNPLDAKGLLLSSIFDDDPVVVMEVSRVMFSRAKNDVPVGDYRVPLGKASVAREGSDVTVIAWGRTVVDSLSAADIAAEDGISVEVIDLRSIVPLDLPTVLASVSKTRRAVIAHSAVEFGGFGGEISSRINEQLFGDLLAPVRRVGAPSAPTPAGPLEASYTPNKGRIAEAIAESAKYAR